LFLIDAEAEGGFQTISPTGYMVIATPLASAFCPDTSYADTYGRVGILFAANGIE